MPPPNLIVSMSSTCGHRSLLARQSLVAVVLVALVGAAFPSALSADHAWGPNHWARTRNPFTLSVGENGSGKTTLDCRKAMGRFGQVV